MYIYIYTHVCVYIYIWYVYTHVYTYYVLLVSRPYILCIIGVAPVVHAEAREDDLGVEENMCHTSSVGQV